MNEGLELNERLQRLRELMAQGNSDLTVYLREQLPQDLAELLEELSEEERLAVFSLLDDERAAELLGELDMETQADVVHSMGTEKAGGIIEEMSTDDAADLLAELTPEEQGRILGEFDEQDEAADVRELMEYHPETAGGRMTTDFVSLRADMSAQEAIDSLREQSPDAETVYYVYVVDSADRLVGVISLRDLICSRPAEQLRAFMKTRVISVHFDDDQEEVAKVVSKYDLLAVPVVDRQGRMLGVVTVDDVIDVLEAEATKDVLALGGAGAPPDGEEENGFLRGVWAMAKPRLPWLVSLLFLEMGSSFISGYFSGFVSAQMAVLLAGFTVVMAGESGNAATQSLAVVVRGLATGEIGPKDLLRTGLREAGTGLLVGTICGVVIGVTSGLMNHNSLFGLAVGLAMLINLFFAKMLGGLFPVIIDRLGIDPAVASGPFITTVTDNTSMLFYYGTAALLLHNLAA